MDVASLISRLEREWDYSLGFFGRLRHGDFDPSGISRLVEICELITPDGGESINRRLVSLLWYMPIFMVWQRDRVREAGGDVTEFERATNRIQSMVEKVLGAP
jgi:hypothetical protein